MTTKISSISSPICVPIFMQKKDGDNKRRGEITQLVQNALPKNLGTLPINSNSNDKTSKNKQKNARV